MNRRIRLTVIMTHPIQYFSPWFRYIEQEAPDLDLTVLYAIEPTAEQQAVEFNRAFTWDGSLRGGYRNQVLRTTKNSDSIASQHFFGLDVAELGDAIRATEPDVALVSGWHSAYLVRAIWECRRAGIPLVYRGDSYLVHRHRGLRSWTWGARTRFILGRFDVWLSVGRLAREYLEFFGAPTERIFDSPHAVDNDFFAREAAPFRDEARRAEARREWGIPDGAYVALFVGKFIERKRPLDVIDALHLMNGDGVLLAVGSGALESECRERAREKNVPVVFRGFLNQSELGRACAIADCLVLPSAYETWGLVVNEAMATGLPCVVSDGVACAPDLIVPGETGEVFSVGDIRALACELTRLRSEKEDGHIRSTKCRERVNQYSYEHATEGLVRACEAVVPR